jgi:hypothetical protein
MSGAPSRLPALTVTVARFAAVPGMTLWRCRPRRRGALQGADGVLEAAQDGRDDAGADRADPDDGGMVTVTGLP